MDQQPQDEDENLSLLLNMGFPDVRAIKRALKLSKGDVNEAVTFLTEQPLTSYSTVDDLTDVDMIDPTQGPPPYDQVVGDNGNSMEFPTTNLYELEGRVFTDTWSIPYKREESLGKCLVSATRLAEEGLCDVDESCHRFLDRCLPECFQKLLANGAVRRWGPEIQEGVFNMLDLLTNLVIARLKHGPVPEDLLKNSYAVALDSECEWNQKNKHRPAEYVGDVTYTESTLQFESYGWLMDLINMFGNRGGFDLIAGRFASGEELHAGQMAALLLPLGQCARFLVKKTVCPILLPAVDQALNYVANLEEKQLKGQKIGSCYELLEAVRLLCESLWPDEVQRTRDLRLDMIIRMLKTPHFSARMNALKELARLIEDSERCRGNGGNVIRVDLIQEWMTRNRVLSLALEGNIDQVQYTDRMKELVEFMGPKLQEEELTRIWHMAEKASPHVVDNIHRIMTAAATRFNPHQFDHLLSLIRKSWDDGNDRLREKLLSFIGKIGLDSRLGRTAEKMLDALWELARVPALPPRLVHQAMNEHLAILNESATRDQLRKMYIVRCVDDIKRSPAVYLPLKQLHYLAQSITKGGGASYFKTEKATLSDLNRSHEIVKLITTSLAKCHALAVSTSGQQSPPPETLIDGKYTHDQYMRVHLEFLQFLLKEGDIYLIWARCKDIWETLVANPKASSHDKEVSTSVDAETCFVWFSGCLGDLEANTQRDLFCEKLLRLDPASLNRPAFNCFVEYFRAVNLSDHKLVRNGNTIVVDKLEPLGMEFIWQLVLECRDEQLAEEAMKLLLDMSYLCLSMRLKRDPPQLHARFISECYRKLEKSLLRVNETAVGAAVSTATKTLTAMAVADFGSLPATSRSSCLQHIRRVLVLAERYVSCIEEQHPGPRSLPPHGASFTGTPLVINVTSDSSRMEVPLGCHSNECMSVVRSRIANLCNVPLDQLQAITFGEGPSSVLVNGSEQDNRLLHHLGINSNITASVKINTVGAAQLKEVGDNWDELPGVASYTDTTDSGSNDGAAGASGAAAVAGPSRLRPGVSAAAVGDAQGSQYNLEQEKQLPGVVMACQGRDVFSMLYQLGQLEEPKIVEAVRHVLYLIPTDPSVVDKFDSICSPGGTTSDASPRTTPYGSPAKRDRVRDKDKDRETGKQVLRSLLDLNAQDMTPFRLLYNMEVLSGKIMPVPLEGTMHGSAHFCEEFLMCGGLSLITALLQRDSLPQEVDYEIRQIIYLITLQILKHLLCGSAPEGQELPVPGQQPHPGPPKRSALDSSAQANPPVTGHSSLTPIIANRVILELSVEEWSEMVSSLMRVSWAGAAGKLYLSLATLNMREPALSPQENSKSSRQSSTGSAHSSSSDSEGILQGGICVQQTTISSIDSLIASQALQLLIACLRFRPQHIERWYTMVNVKDFLVEVLVGCTCQEVREMAYRQFTSLITIATSSQIHPKQFLTQVLLKAPLPLWVPSTSARGATLRLLSHCTEYFSLRSKLLSGLSATEQEVLGINAHQMLEDESGWLTNFNATREASRERPESGIATLRHADNVLLAGHLTLITALLSCEGINKEEFGASLIPLLITEYLFPASKMVLETGPGPDSLSSSRNYSPKCTGKESRMAAYQLLISLVMESEQNLSMLAGQLVSLHHKLNPDFIKEFEYAPAVDGRCASGYVGLKNGGATCYMNSVLQQLFLVQGIPEDILAVCSDEESEESLFYQLQTVFGHLMESQLQYYVPDKFWKCFRMDGQPVNVREQQDAFEFYTRLTEQIDEYLKSQRHERVFARRFEGIYSIQRICQDCPHRYEREEPFLALNLTVTKCHDLQDSLDQFVKGELLEGDNAYYCEKCSQKRTALIRTCVKTLPPVLVIQLKRFGYDWEASRALKFDDYFQFPWVLDMGSYTAEGIAEREEDPGGGGGGEERTRTPDEKESLSPKVNTSRSPRTCRASHKSGHSSNTSPRTSRINTRAHHRRAMYELVGVIVHSGQASAGHYYSYIKDRRGDPLTNPNKGRWFKFNDTSVEPVEMTDSLLEQECFGGTYKAKVSYDSSNPLPEDRLRYWNGYMLVYDSVDDRMNTPKTPKTPRVGVTSRSFRASTSSVRKSLSLSGGSSERRARTSLCELSQLLQEGERQGMFRELMPPRILSTITHENLTFLKNRDLFSQDYFNFIYQLCSVNLEKNQDGKLTPLGVQTVKLGLNFLLNTYLRIKDKEESLIIEWRQLLESQVQEFEEACSWVVQHLSGEEGVPHLQPLLLECPNKIIRVQFSNLLSSIFKEEFKHKGNVSSLSGIVKHLLSFLASDVPAAVKTSQQYFSLLYTYCQQGIQQCRQILSLGGFSCLLNFLLGPAETDKRRWSSVLAQDFGPLHSTLAIIISACDMVPYQTKVCEKSEDKSEKITMPDEVAQVLYGSERPRWLREVVLAYREVTGNIPQLTSALKAAATENPSFTNALLTALMTDYAKSPSNLLKDLSQLLLEILNICDSLQSTRTTAVLEGFESSNKENIMGLLDMIGMNKDHDSRRAYQCIKLVVTLSARCPLARDHLTSTQIRWQWAVEWLRGRMDDHSAMFQATTGLSNEDSNTKNFQRTTSAQLTLEEATALLSELESAEMEIDSDHVELGDIKEIASERETSPSDDLDGIDP